MVYLFLQIPILFILQVALAFAPCKAYEIVENCINNYSNEEKFAITSEFDSYLRVSSKSEYLVIENCTFTNISKNTNEGVNGGSILCCSTRNNYLATITIRDSTFIECRTSKSGGVAYIESSSIKISVIKSNFINCTSDKPGAVIYMKAIHANTTFFCKSSLFSECRDIELQEIGGVIIHNGIEKGCLLDCKFTKCSKVLSVIGKNVHSYEVSRCKFNSISSTRSNSGSILVTDTYEFLLIINQSDFSFCGKKSMLSYALTTRKSTIQDKLSMEIIDTIFNSNVGCELYLCSYNNAEIINCYIRRTNDLHSIHVEQFSNLSIFNSTFSSIIKAHQYITGSGSINIDSTTKFCTYLQDPIPKINFMQIKKQINIYAESQFPWPETCSDNTNCEIYNGATDNIIINNFCSSGCNGPLIDLVGNTYAAKTVQITSSLFQNYNSAASIPTKGILYCSAAASLDVLEINSSCFKSNMINGKYGLLHIGVINEKSVFAGCTFQSNIYYSSIDKNYLSSGCIATTTDVKRSINSLILKECSFLSNEIGCIVLLKYAINLESITNCTFKGNYHAKSYSNSIKLKSITSTTISNCYFYDNGNSLISTQCISLENCSAVLDQCTICGCNSGIVPTLEIRSNVVTSLLNSFILDNKVGNNTGIIDISLGRAYLTGCSFNFDVDYNEGCSSVTATGILFIEKNCFSSSVPKALVHINSLNIESNGNNKFSGDESTSSDFTLKDGDVFSTTVTCPREPEEPLPQESKEVTSHSTLTEDNLNSNEATTISDEPVIGTSEKISYLSDLKQTEYFPTSDIEIIESSYIKEEFKFCPVIDTESYTILPTDDITNCVYPDLSKAYALFNAGKTITYTRISIYNCKFYRIKSEKGTGQIPSVFFLSAGLEFDLLSIKNCLFEDCTSKTLNGGVFYLNLCKAKETEILECKFIRASVSNLGSAIYFKGDGKITAVQKFSVMKSSFSTCQETSTVSSNGGVIFVSDTEDVQINECKFSEQCTRSLSFNDLACLNVSIKNCKFLDNLLNIQSSVIYNGKSKTNTKFYIINCNFDRSKESGEFSSTCLWFQSNKKIEYQIFIIESNFNENTFNEIKLYSTYESLSLKQCTFNKAHNEYSIILYLQNKASISGCCFKSLPSFTANYIQGSIDLDDTCCFDSQQDVAVDGTISEPIPLVFGCTKCPLDGEETLASDQEKSFSYPSINDADTIFNPSANDVEASNYLDGYTSMKSNDLIPSSDLIDNNNSPSSEHFLESITTDSEDKGSCSKIVAGETYILTDVIETFDNCNTFKEYTGENVVFKTSTSTKTQTLIISNCLFMSISSKFSNTVSGCIAYLASSILTSFQISSCTFTDCGSIGQSGGLFYINTVNTIVAADNISVTRAKCKYQGVVYYSSAKTNTFTNCHFFDCSETDTTTNAHGGILLVACTDSSNEIKDCTFEEDCSKGIYFMSYRPKKVLIDNCTFNKCQKYPAVNPSLIGFHRDSIPKEEALITNCEFIECGAALTNDHAIILIAKPKSSATSPKFVGKISNSVFSMSIGSDLMMLNSFMITLSDCTFVKSSTGYSIDASIEGTLALQHCCFSSVQSATKTYLFSDATVSISLDSMCCFDSSKEAAISGNVPQDTPSSIFECTKCPGDSEIDYTSYSDIDSIFSSYAPTAPPFEKNCGIFAEIGQTYEYEGKKYDGTGCNAPFIYTQVQSVLTIRITDCMFKNYYCNKVNRGCISVSANGGIFLMQVRSTTFMNCGTVRAGAALCIQGTNTLSVANCTFESCYLDDDIVVNKFGSAFSAHDSIENLYIDDCSFNNCPSGGLSIRSGCVLKGPISRCNFTNNEAAIQKDALVAGLYTEVATTIDECIFSKNKCNIGSAILMKSESTMKFIVSNCEIMECESKTGGVLVCSQTVEISNCAISSNIAQTTSGVLVAPGKSSVTIIDSTFLSSGSKSLVVEASARSIKLSGCCFYVEPNVQIIEGINIDSTINIDVENSYFTKSNIITVKSPNKLPSGCFITDLVCPYVPPSQDITSVDLQTSNDFQTSIESSDEPTLTSLVKEQTMTSMARDEAGDQSSEYTVMAPTIEITSIIISYEESATIDDHGTLPINALSSNEIDTETSAINIIDTKEFSSEQSQHNNLKESVDTTMTAVFQNEASSQDLFTNIKIPESSIKQEAEPPNDESSNEDKETILGTGEIIGIIVAIVVIIILVIVIVFLLRHPKEDSLSTNKEHEVDSVDTVMPPCVLNHPESEIPLSAIEPPNLNAYELGPRDPFRNDDDDVDPFDRDFLEE